MRHAVFHLSKLGSGKKILIGLMLAAAVLTALFDWNWLRLPLQHYLSEKSGREITIDDLHVKLGLHLEPTVRLRGVHIPNASWASSQPMADAGEAIFTFSLRSVWQDRPVISRLVLRDANVVLERHANGLRNWRLLNPEARGPGKIRVLTLEPHRSQIRFVHHGIEFEVAAAASPRQHEATARKDEPVLSNRIDFKGSYLGTRFSGVTLTGTRVSFIDSGIAFPVRGHISSGSTRLDIDGVLADVLALSAMDAKVRIEGPSLSRLYPFAHFRPAASRPYELEAQVIYGNSVYTARRLRGKIGDTRIAGELTYNRQNQRPFVSAALESDRADIDDLSALADINYPAAEAPAQNQEAADTAEGRASPRPPKLIDSGHKGNRLFDVPIHVDRLKALDARVTMFAKRLDAAEMPALESGRLTLNLDDGRLQLDPVELGMAGGRVAGSVTVNVNDQPPSSEATINASDIRLERMFPSIAAASRSVAPVGVRMRLAGRGKSLAGMLGDGTGFLAAMMERGSISNLADAKLGMNTMKILGLSIRGDRDIAINCGAVAFDFRNGKGKSRSVVLDTEETRVDGVGTIDLRALQLDLTLTPRLKKPAIFSREKSIRVQGPLGNWRWTVVDRIPLPRAETKAPPALQALLRTAENGARGGRCAAILSGTGGNTREER
jgi:AsmA family protein